MYVVLAGFWLLPRIDQYILYIPFKINFSQQIQVRLELANLAQMVRIAAEVELHAPFDAHSEKFGWRLIRMEIHFRCYVCFPQQLYHQCEQFFRRWRVSLPLLP